MSYPAIDYKASPNHSDRGDAPIEFLVFHATVGPFASSLAWLRNPQPNNPDDRVSSHYLIRKDGHIAQLVADDQAAWHAGHARWLGHADINERSISIELENDNSGRDPYPAAQLDSCRDLSRSLIARHHIKRAGVARHLDVATPKGRKTDPAGFPWLAFVESLYAPLVAAPELIAANALLIHPPRANQAQCVAYFTRHATGGYTRFDVSQVVSAYFAVCATAEIDPVLAIAQMAHETGSLTSWWSQRPRRNPAGIGVTGAGRTRKPSTSVWQLKGSQWLEGIAFASWKDDAIPAHVGRLLAYALKDDQALRGQLALIRVALSERPLPLTHRGCAPTLAGLNGRWAVPGRDYADKIAAIATAITRMKA